MIFAGLITTSSSALFAILCVAWGVVWGVLSLAVIGVWLRPRFPWLLLGLLGPLGPFIALIVGLLMRDRSVDGGLDAT
jgi:hypothetical protein